MVRVLCTSFALGLALTACAAFPRAVMAIDLSRLYGHLSSKRSGKFRLISESWSRFETASLYRHGHLRKLIMSNPGHLVGLGSQTTITITRILRIFINLINQQLLWFLWYRIVFTKSRILDHIIPILKVPVKRILRQMNSTSVIALFIYSSWERDSLKAQSYIPLCVVYIGVKYWLVLST